MFYFSALFFRILLLLLFISPVAIYSMSYMQKGNALYESGSYDSAIILYQQAIEAGENPGLAGFNIGNAHFQLQNIPAAIIAYRSSVAHAPDFFRGHLNLAVAYYTIDQIGECIAALHKALGIEPQNIQARLVMASAYRKAGELKLAVVLYEQIVENNPDQGDAFIALAEIYRELEDYVVAVRWLKRYPPEGVHYTYVLQSLSEIAQKQGDLKQALYYARESFSQEEKKWTAYRIVTLTNDMGNPNVALYEVDEALKIYPDFGELALLGGKIAFDIQLYEKARQFFSIAAKQGMPGGIVGLENVRTVSENRKFE